MVIQGDKGQKGQEGSGGGTGVTGDAGNKGQKGTTGAQGNKGTKGDIISGGGYFEITNTGRLTFKQNGWTSGDPIYYVRTVNSGSFL